MANIAAPRCDAAGERNTCSVILTMRNSTMPDSLRPFSSAPEILRQHRRSRRKTTDYEIQYTFGVTPLQQYLIECPDGQDRRFRSPGTRARKSKAGRAGFTFIPTSGSPTTTSCIGPVQHKTGISCARIATPPIFAKITMPPGTNFRHDGQKSAWVAKPATAPARAICIGRSRAACKGSRVRLRKSWRQGPDRRLDERRGITWNHDAASGNAARSQPRATDREIEVCAQCHARRAHIAEGYVPGSRFSITTARRFSRARFIFADGQQRDEVYIWGSFPQSKMYASGMTCSDCHDPHTAKLLAEGNAICATCHLRSKYDMATHHLHKSDSAGAACASCHMPTTDLYACRSAPRSQPARASAGSHPQIRNA